MPTLTVLTSAIPRDKADGPRLKYTTKGCFVNLERRKYANAYLALGHQNLSLGHSPVPNQILGGWNTLKTNALLVLGEREGAPLKIAYSTVNLVSGKEV